MLLLDHEFRLPHKYDEVLPLDVFLQSCIFPIYNHRLVRIRQIFRHFRVNIAGEIHFNHLRIMIELSFINKILHDTTDLFFQYKYICIF